MRNERRNGIMHPMKRTVVASVGAILFLAGCGNSGADEPDLTAQAEQICLDGIRDQLKDPNSAEFQDVTVEDRGETSMTFLNEDGSEDVDVPGNYWRVEGQVNARNGFGGMVGFRDFACEAEKYEGRDMSTGYVDIDSR
jgi:hypothetical protein